MKHSFMTICAWALLPMAAGAWQDDALNALAAKAGDAAAFPPADDGTADSLSKVAAEKPDRPAVQGLDAWMQELPDLLRRTAETGDATLRSPHGFTALQAACLFGDEALAHALVEAGADVNARPNEWRKMGVVGQSPLGLLLSRFKSAPKEVQLRLGRYLLEHGADPDAEMTYTNPGFPQIYWEPAFRMVSDSDVQLMLLDFGEQDLTKRGLFRKGYVDCCPHDNPALVRKMVLGGLDPNHMVGEKNKNILRASVAVGNVELVKFLLEHGAKPQDALFHFTVEEKTSRYCDSTVFLVFPDAPTSPEDAVAIAKLLLDHGADINALDWAGNGLRIHYGKHDTPTAKALCEFFKSRGAVLHPDARRSGNRATHRSKVPNKKIKG